MDLTLTRKELPREDERLVQRRRRPALRLLLCIGVLGSTGPGGFTTVAAETTPTGPEYEPCHVLCSNEMGRVEPFRLDPFLASRNYAFSLLSAYVSPRGHYEMSGYIPVSAGASAHVLQVVPAFSYFINDTWTAQLRLPFEYNRTRGLVLPTLHEENTKHSTIEPDGVTLSFEYRVPRRLFARFVARIGGGYRLSMPSGTVDVAAELPQQPDKALEALGFGSDDLFVTGGLRQIPSRGAWVIGVGGELRLHTLPRLRRRFATTYAYYVDASRRTGSRWQLYGRASGFSTHIRVPKVTQANRAILLAGSYYRCSEAVTLSVALKGEVPLTVANTNSLQTIGLNWGFTVAR